MALLLLLLLLHGYAHSSASREIYLLPTLRAPEPGMVLRCKAVKAVTTAAQTFKMVVTERPQPRLMK